MVVKIVAIRGNELSELVVRPRACRRILRSIGEHLALAKVRVGRRATGVMRVDLSDALGGVIGRLNIVEVGGVVAAENHVPAGVVPVIRSSVLGGGLDD